MYWLRDTDPNVCIRYLPDQKAHNHTCLAKQKILTQMWLHAYFPVYMCEFLTRLCNTMQTCNKIRGGKCGDRKSDPVYVLQINKYFYRGFSMSSGVAVLWHVIAQISNRKKQLFLLLLEFYSSVTDFGFCFVAHHSICGKGLIYLYEYNAKYGFLIL